MRLLLLVLISACSLPPQTLASPCVGQPVTDGGMCPACSTDADCYVLTNPCQEGAACVRRGSSWAVTLEGCSVEHPPPTQQCGCVDSVCQSR